MKTEQETLKCQCLVVKIASRCNLNCTYCYMYNMGDETYKSQPKVMSDEVVDALLLRVRNHCIENSIDNFAIIFHGGEPMLAGHRFFENFVKKAEAILKDCVTLHMSIQTNGVLLNDEWCELFGRLNIYVGISLDGTPEQNDKFRIDHAGRGSYKKIAKGIRTAVQSPHLKRRPGLLCVVDVNSDPLETYNHFKALKVDGIDFLMPDSNYEKRPPQKDNATTPAEIMTPYADWFIKMFDLWYREKENRVTVRFFRNILQGLLGKEFVSEQIGMQNNEVLIIETNGSIETSDILKICGHGFTKDNSHVLTTELSDALQTDLVKLYNLSHRNLCQKCMKCPVVEICGGGFLPHRYRKENGFDNPSVYCLDLLKLITHIQNRLVEQMPEEVLEASGMSAITFEDALCELQENES